VDVELSLLVDVSGSISRSEFELQKQGYSDAFRDPDVLNTIAAHPNGIAVNLAYWASSASQVQAVPYTRLKDQASAIAFADQIAASARPFSGSTAVGEAIHYGAGTLAANEFSGSRWVIDLSGDGRNNSGRSAASARDAALASGVHAINGLPIGSTSLGEYFTNEVMGGEGAFVQHASSFDDFSAAIRQKLSREITPHVQVAQVQRNPQGNLTPMIDRIQPDPRNAHMQLRAFDGTSFGTAFVTDEFRSRPTIVLTHGWNSSPANAFARTDHNFGSPAEDTALAQALHNRFGHQVNIVAWDWSGQAGADTGLLRPDLAQSRTLSQGQGLGHALADLLGTDYERPVQFVGHSFGTLVNAEAIDVFQGILSNDISIQATLFDEASTGNVFSLGGAVEAGIRNWANPIADRADWTENYITFIGNQHKEAVNVFLQDAVTLNPIKAHRHPIDWYAYTVDFPTVSDMGSRWGLGRGVGADSLPVQDSYYRQTINPLDSEHDLTEISRLEMAGLLALRDNATRRLITVGAATSYTGRAIDAVGEVVAGFFVKAVEESTPRFALRVLLEENSPAYAWLPLSVPDNAEYFSFDFLFSGLGDDDFLTVGIDDTLVFAMEGEFIDPDSLYNSGLIDVSAWAGQEVEVFLGYNSDGVKSGTITIEDPRFLTTVPEPASVFLFACGVLMAGLPRGRGHRALAC